MLRRTMAIALALTLVTAAGSAMAQTCLLGLYADADGIDSVSNPILGEFLDVYAVIKAESTVNAVSQSVTFPPDFNVTGAAYGPTGFGLNIQGPGGENIGLGECAIGFGGLPILVATYTAIVVDAGFQQTVATIGPNPDEDANFPVYSDCGGVLHTCGNTLDMIVSKVVAVDSASFGSVKSLYSN